MKLKIEKRNLVSLFLLAVLVLIAVDVSALGVAPARRIVDFEPNLKYTNEITITNDNKDMKVSIDVQGELSDYIKLSQVLVDFTKDVKEKKVKYELELPATVLKPGNNDITLVITELPSEAGVGTFVGARISVLSQVRVRLPYPGKYVEADLNVFEASAGNNVIFVVPVHNLGTEGISKATATIEILGPTNDIINVFDTSKESIEAGKRKELRALWMADVDAGSYYANVVVDYDGKKAEVGKSFEVGGFSIAVNSVDVDKVGDIAKFKISLRNMLNDDLEGVYATINVYDLDENLIAEFKTPHENIASNENKELLGYWDTVGVEKGEYKAKLIIHYGAKTIEKDLEASLSASGISVSMIGTGKAIALSGFDYKFNSVFMIAIFILIIINVFWFIYFKIRSRKSQDL